MWAGEDPGEAFVVLRQPASHDDVLYAAVAPWTAVRVAGGRAGRLLTAPTVDPRGL